MAAVDAFAPDLPIYRHLGRTEAQRDWLARLPSLVASYERRWGISTGSPFRAGTSSWAAPATTADGRDAVLKIAWPHPEAREEGTGLRFWAGDGAVLAYETDRADYALLLERCVPGTTLAEAGLSTEDSLTAGAGVAHRLWSRTPPAESTMDDMGTVTREWAVLVRERMAWHQPPFDRGVVAHAADLLAALPSSAARRVVVHGDLNPGNLLAAQRHPWLAIDAKPMVGDPAYDPSPLLCQVDNPFTAADPEGEVRRRYAMFAALVGEPADRLLGWTLARMVESALWLVDSGRPEPAEAEMRDATVVARVLGV